MKKILFTLCSIMMLIPILSGCNSKTSDTKNESTVIHEDLSQYFIGYDGCFLLFDQNKQELTVYNEPKTEKSLSPCSTFKVINTLAGLETKVLQDENTTFKWDGTHYYNEAWNQDQTLAMAVSNSTFWYFQQVAKQVGPERMSAFLKKIDFGNKDISGGITQFWEQSSLKITPRAWLEMLKKIHSYEIPVAKTPVDTLKKVIKLSEQNGAVLSGKTGSGLKSGMFIPQGTDDPYINGWFVGYVEKDGNVYYFVSNIEGSSEATGANAKKITLNILKDKGIFK